MSPPASKLDSGGPRRRGLLSEARDAHSADGTRIAYYVTSPPRSDAPVLVVANGLGGPRQSFRGLMQYFEDRYRFITWDYRGLYGSDRPRESAGDDAYGMTRHVDDLEAILDAEGVQRAGFIGWSMGVQVCLEAYRRLHARVSSLVLLNGTFGRPLDSAVPRATPRRLVQSALVAAERMAGPIESFMRRAASMPEFVPMMKRFGVMAETIDDHEFAEVVSMFATLEFDVFLKNLRALGEHDAERILPQINAPVLVVTGDRDKLTPHGLAQQMARKIPRAELLVVRGGTHYAAVEFPELIALRMERFYRAHVAG